MIPSFRNNWFKKSYFQTERVKSAAAFKDVITLKNAKVCFFTPFSLSQSQSQIRQLEVELMKVQAESDLYQVILLFSAYNLKKKTAAVEKKSLTSINSRRGSNQW